MLVEKLEVLERHCDKIERMTADIIIIIIIILIIIIPTFIMNGQDQCKFIMNGQDQCKLRCQ